MGTPQMTTTQVVTLLVIVAIAIVLGKDTHH